MSNILNFNKNKILLIGIILIVLIGIPLTILQSQKEQDIRQRASEQTEEAVSLVLECAPKRICEDIEVNDEFSVEIRLKNENKLDITAFMFTINYDETLLELSGFEPKQTKFDPPIFNETAIPGIVQYAAATQSITEKDKVTDNNIFIGRLDFKAKQEGSGNAYFANSQVTSSAKKDEALEVDNQDLAFSITPMSESCNPEGKKSACEKIDFICKASEVCTQRPGADEGKKNCTCYPAAPIPGGVLLDLSLSLENIKADRKDLPSSVALTKATIEVLSKDKETKEFKSVTEEKTNLEYYPGDGKFRRFVELGKIPPGEYQIKIKADKYLKKLVPKIITVAEVPEEEIQTIPVELTEPLLRSVDALDFNSLVNCYGSKLSTDSCLLDQDSADLNFDEVVDIVDLNIVLRNFGKTDD